MSKLAKIALFIFGTLQVVFLVVVGYFYYVLKSAPSTPQTMQAMIGSAPEEREFKGAVKVPASVAGFVPANYTLGGRLEKVGAEEGAGYGGMVPLSSVVKTEAGGIRIVPTDSLQAGQYRVRVYLCEAGKNPCRFGVHVLEGAKLFTIPENHPGKMVDMGQIPINRRFTWPKPCGPEEKVVAGTIVPTEEWLSSPAARRKNALVAINPFGASWANLGPNSLEARANPGSDGFLYWHYVGYVDQNILGAQFYEPKAGGSPFSLALEGQSQGEHMFLLMVQCERSDDPKSCARRAFPLPESTYEAPGRATILRAKSFLVPHCGARDLTMYLHHYPFKANGATPPPRASLPEEVLY